MTEARHTELPWSVKEGGSVVEIIANGTCIMRTCTMRYHDKFSAMDLTNATLVIKAVNNHQALVDALERSAQGWTNVIEMGLVPEQHYTTVVILRDEARDALKAVQS